MSRKIEILNIENLFERYFAGEDVKKLLNEFGISSTTLYRKLSAAGLQARPRRTDIPDLDQIIARYVAGESEKALSVELGVNRDVFRLRLKEAGVTIRGRSEGMTARWARADDTERSRMLDNAHASTRGITIPVESKRRHAIAIERKGRNLAYPAENILADSLTGLGWTITQQMALDIYNIDIALNEAPLAVEVFGGGWHSQGRHLRRFHERTKCILNSGWHVLIVWVDGLRYPLDINCTNYIHGWAQELRSNPAAVRQYRVILGNGELAPISKVYLNTPTDIERFGHRIDAAGSKYDVSG